MEEKNVFEDKVALQETTSLENAKRKSDETNTLARSPVWKQAIRSDGQFVRF